jgi:hypothetical protein
MASSLFQEMYDHSFADIVTVYGMANMNQPEKRRVGREQGPGTFFSPCIIVLNHEFHLCKLVTVLKSMLIKGIQTLPSFH